MSFAAKFPGTCTKCSRPIPAGASVNYDPETRKIRHAPRCPAASTGPAGLAVPPPAAPPQTVTDDQKIIGKATYKGKAGYLILWMGTTSRGEAAARLAFRDGSKIFWANQSDIVIEKRYHDREWRGRTEPGMTFGRLNRLAADFKAAKAEGIEPCGKCGGIHRNTDKSCYMCGCTKCDGAHGGLCEDD